jgi:hypothetical protein
MLYRFWAVRSIRDVRSVLDFVVYAVKYAPATCFLVYALRFETQDRIAGLAGIFTAAAIVIFGVEGRAAIRRRWPRAVSLPSLSGSGSSATPFLKK